MLSFEREEYILILSVFNSINMRNINFRTNHHLFNVFSNFFMINPYFFYAFICKICISKS